MLKILGKSSSINVRKVLWTCAELSLPYELEEWGSGFRSTDVPQFRALNPNALVPVVIDAGQALWESNTICRYLAGKQGRTDLLPADPLARAQVEMWMDWQATEFNNAWRYAFMALVRNSPKHTDAAAIAAGIADWNRHAAIVDARLAATGGYIAGPAFTLADVVIGLSVQRWLAAPLQRPELPALAAYVERLRAREGFLLHGCNGMP
ncbi:MAG TPA: glutathione S-transferase [Telluria sp.]|nr:glutathione S-transferase [Telluria sp.]